MKITVLHERYGCETGCCGHVIEVDGKRATLKDGRSFAFHHYYDDTDGDKLEWARQWVSEEFGAEHVKDLDWENCVIGCNGGC